MAPPQVQRVGSAQWLSAEHAVAALQQMDSIDARGTKHIAIMPVQNTMDAITHTAAQLAAGEGMSANLLLQVLRASSRT